MRLIFIATGDIALPSFRYLLEHGPRPLALVTQPDKPVGRHQTLTPPAIKVVALAAGITVHQPETIGDAFAELHALDPEVLVVMAYGQILRKEILNLATQAIINLHASILPKYRGAACIQAAIAAGDLETGITAMHVVRELDAGDIILIKTLAIAADETGGGLHDRLGLLAAEVLAEVIVNFTNGTAGRVPQDDRISSYIPKLERDDGRLDWTQDAATIERRIRAYEPWPGTFTVIREDGREKRLKIFPPTQVVESTLPAGEFHQSSEGKLLIGCGTQALLIEWVQPEGSRRMSAEDYLRGRKRGVTGH